MTLITADLAGPVIHARKLLAGTGEQLLWAAHAKHYQLDIRGFESARVPSVDLSGIPMKVANSVVDGILDTPDTHTPDYSPDVVVVGSTDMQAFKVFEHQFGRTLWVLTPAGLRVGRVATNTKPEPEPEPEPSKGFFGGVVHAAKSFTDAFAKQTVWPQMPTYPVELEFEVPRRDIRGFTVAARGVLRSKLHCLRMELVDGSGYDLVFGAGKNRAQIERMHALTLGAAE
ncbi:hypothetical protein [Actinokineospora diospyrosa]|uniref:Uncharacterized protein n=1 Tax=Actinokineospora diospyrosa TaxID=103728 RepID=A0ABT1ID58_9PSEU|nr:hypothetical protein [Actinokineospora diospyrosa]MCP2270563.1 hypothetical protein [Actinokineospora diospyrosa]